MPGLDGNLYMALPCFGWFVIFFGAAYFLISIYAKLLGHLLMSIR